ncbi:MAG TPA: acyltransferase [Spongiibacteraceae bacterium]|nr:acyltransferase [Spongiibacteraceae bacterium]
MPASALFEIPFELSLCMLAAMCASVLIAMAVLSRALPMLSAEAHDTTRWMDGLRGIAAVSVALNHAPVVFFNLLLKPEFFTYIWRELVLFWFLGAFGVQIFFCITGMLFASKVLCAERVDWTTFFDKRIRRIAPAYAAACTFALAIVIWYVWPIKPPAREIFMALPRLLSFGFLPLPTIGEFSFDRVLGVNWTLAIEWRYYLVLPIVFVFMRHLRWVSVIAIVAFAVADVLLTGKSVWIYFISGALCAPLMYRQFGPRLRLLGYAGILLALGLYIKYWEGLKLYGPEQWPMMTLLFASLSIARPRLLTTRLFVALGTVSYSFYLLHSMALVVVVAAFHRYVFDLTVLSVGSFTLLVCVALMLTTGFATLSYLYIERPFMRSSGRAAWRDRSAPRVDYAP